ncbi:hypothetical protein [Mycolicibacterium sphagni]|uniref:Uncharacterized protein n=1 Tax=Mycolicibacterium sphagni TaxID=1786 RepID=A0ABX2K2A5_9MYCO|nr:hypothetical protein [Mycolicibacterium sphagni]NTY62204.1 hypothetical protein [Mycolicibacterium sphagni]
MPDTTECRVTWEIDIDADNPHAAAAKALAIQRNPESIATFFGVTARSGGATNHVDFHDDDAPSTTN